MEKTQLSPILDDQPAQKDYLDFQSYCQALKDLIVHPSTKTPLTLGIFGRWGSGKTTLMRMLERELKTAGIATVWFNAWQYGKEDELWAAFLQSILNKMKDDLHLFQEIRFGIKLLWNRIDWCNALEHVLQYLLRILVVVSPIIVTWPLAQQVSQGAYEAIVRVGGGAVSVGLGLWVFVKPLIEAVRQNITIDFSVFQQVSDYQKHIAFLDRFRDHFEDIVHSLPQKSEKRLAVFIDDLDRCLPDRTLQVLDAIKLFVDIRGCIYILGLDLDIVQKAVAAKYKDDPVAQREYLGKIIQIPFQLPPLTRDEMRDFIERIVLELPDVRCRGVFVEGLIVNPREVKRTINVFSLLWNLAATRRELVGLITPVRLAKVVVIQHGHPNLHRLLQERPYLLIELERFLRQEQAMALEQVTAEQLEDAGERTKTEEAEKEVALASAAELPPELQPFTKRETLRRMLLLHELKDPEKDDANFANLGPDAIGVYFTLTRRAEAPSAEAPEPSFPSIGSTIAHRYEIIEEIGRGGMSKVYLAEDWKREQRVAIKVLAPYLAQDEEFVARFNQEIKSLYQLEHPNIVQIYDHGTDAGRIFYTMEYFSGGTLKSAIDRKGRLSLRETVRIALPILDALAYVHRSGYVHCDIKPATFLFDAQGMPKLTDFGLARDLSKDILGTTGVVVGTPAYLSPEQAKASKIDGRSDLYAFGVVLYECLTGQPPFKADTPVAIIMKHITDPPPPPRTLNPGIPQAVEDVIVKLLEKDPDNRYATAEEVKKALIQA